MQSNDVEKFISDFLERREYDEAANALHTVVRAAFLAGWNAAGGEPPTPHKIFEVVPGKEPNKPE